MKLSVRRVLRMVMPVISVTVFVMTLHAAWGGLPIVARDYGQVFAKCISGALLVIPVLAEAVLGLALAGSEWGGLLMGTVCGVYFSALTFCCFYLFEPPIPAWLAVAEGALVLVAFVVPGYLRSRGLIRVTVEAL